MESVIIGTAGHIDHGKTALVRALTGRDTDTLEEEQRRGITINLGFAYVKLPDGKIAGIVDVPGHERFIKNMLAGSSGMDIAMVLVAANEGIMPQTKEHIDILSYMQIQESIVVLSKIDMVDEEFKELVLDDTKEYLKNTFLKDSPIIEVDSLSGKGIDELKNQLSVLANRIKKRNLNRDARLHVDRVFSVKGFGTVVTGTLGEGVINIDDELTVYPQGIIAKVRSLQVHDQPVSIAYAGQRTAINLAGVTVEQIKRGNVVAKNDSVCITKALEVRFSMIKNTSVTIKKMQMLKMYIGAKELVVNIIPLGQKQVKAGEETYGQIILQENAVVRKGDKFVLRTISPVYTVGGGIIVDPTAILHKKVTSKILESIKAKDSSKTSEMIEEFVRSHPFMTNSQIVELVNAENLDTGFAELEADAKLLNINGLYIHADLIDLFLSDINHILSSYHKDFPLRSGISKAELLSKQNTVKESKFFEILLIQLENLEKISVNGSSVCLNSFEPQYSQKQKTIQKEIEKEIIDCSYTPRTIKEIVGSSQDRRQVMEFMLQDTLVTLEGQYVLNKELYQNAKDIIIKLASEFGLIKLSDFRDAIKTSRKYALLILEKFDREKFTIRKGEDRALINKSNNT